jgi:hypothetical protein
VWGGFARLGDASPATVGGGGGGVPVGSLAAAAAAAAVVVAAVVVGCGRRGASSRAERESLVSRDDAV